MTRRRISGGPRAALLAAVASVLAGPARAEDWSSWGLGAERRRQSREATGAAFREEWRHVVRAEGPLSPGIATSPAVADGFVVFGTLDHSLRVLRATTGQEVWRFAAEGGFVASPVLHRGRVLAASLDGTLYGFRAGDGKALWRLELATSYGSPALDGGDGLLVATALPEGGLYRVDSRTGEVWWRTAAEAVARSSQSSPAVGEGLVVLGAVGGTYHGLDLHTGQPRWTYDTGGDVFMSSPLVAGRSVYLLAGGATPKLHAVDLRTGQAREGWPLSIEPPQAALDEPRRRLVAKSSLAIADGLLVFQVRFVDLLPRNPGDPADRYRMHEHVFAVSPDGPRVHWSVANGAVAQASRGDIPTLSACPTPAAFRTLAGDTLLAVTSTLAATVRVLEARTGRELWMARTSGPTRASPTFANGRLYVATDAGVLHAFLSQANRPPAAPQLAPDRDALPDSGGLVRFAAAEPGKRLSYVVRLDRDGEVLEDWELELVAPAGALHVRVPGRLEPGAVYHAAARARDEHGALSDWSALRAFPVVATPPVSLAGLRRATLAEALAAAAPGSVISLGPGTFPLGEPVRVPAGVSLTGSGAHATILDAQGLETAVVLEGHAPGHRSAVKQLAIAGAEVGVEVRAAARAELRNVVVRDSRVAGVRVAGDGSAEVVNATLTGNAIAVEGHGSTLVKNSLVFGNEVGLAARAPGALESRYNDLFDNGTAYDGIRAPASDLSVPVEFVDAPGKDFRLRPEQPSTDRGDPDDDFSNEPFPHGARVNLGAFGNTAQAELSPVPPAPPGGEVDPAPRPGGGRGACAVARGAGPAAPLVLLFVGLGAGALRRRSGRNRPGRWI